MLNLPNICEPKKFQNITYINVFMYHVLQLFLNSLLRLSEYSSIQSFNKYHVLDNVLGNADVAANKLKPSPYLTIT